MARKPIIAIAGALVTSLALAGCQNGSGSRGNGNLPSGPPLTKTPGAPTPVAQQQQFPGGPAPVSRPGGQPTGLNVPPAPMPVGQQPIGGAPLGQQPVGQQPIGIPAGLSNSSPLQGGIPQGPAVGSPAPKTSQFGGDVPLPPPNQGLPRATVGQPPAPGPDPFQGSMKVPATPTFDQNVPQPPARPVGMQQQTSYPIMPDLPAPAPSPLGGPSLSKSSPAGMVSPAEIAPVQTRQINVPPPVLLPQ